MNTPAKFTAKMNQPVVAWRLRNTRSIVVGPTPRLVLALRATRDVTLLHSLVEYHDAVEVEAALVELPHFSGQRRLRPEGEPWVYGTEDAGAKAVMAHVRRLEHNVCLPPNCWWGARHRIDIPKGFSVGIIVMAKVPTVARAKLSGE